MTTPPVPDDPVLDNPVLDNPVWSALTTRHAGFAEGGDVVRRYRTDVSPFLGVADPSDPRTVPAILDLVGPGADVGVSHAAAGIVVPEDWTWTLRIPGVQLVDSPDLRTRPLPGAVELGAGDVPEMLDLVARTRPGPFLPRTHELGRYVGVRRDGALVAMGGERLRPDGWTEISAVAVDPAHRRQGLASGIVLDVAHHARARGDRVLLHASADNHGAIAAYRALGFTLRRELLFGVVRTPG